MSRLSFEKKRAQQPVAHPAVVSVRVFGATDASVGGTPVAAAPGEPIQQAVLNHLQRLAISLGTPIRATIHDDRAGCVVPLEVAADGSSQMTGEPVRVAPRPQPWTPDAVSGPRPLPLGAVQVPTGSFGPPPVMDAPPVISAAAAAAAAGSGAPAAEAPAPAKPSAPGPGAVPVEPEFRHVATHTPPRGFDAVAEEVLGDGPLTETAEGAELLTEPMTRINEAVRAGRIEAAAELADRTVEEASAVLGARHAEVLHLRELTAYIAYLAGDPVRAFHLSLDLARLRRDAQDGEAAYDNVRSAATAWRAVRDPEEGLRLGRDLIDLWTDLTAEPGPAADDPHPLESARARMIRLTDRAARAAQP
ncbi:hypothetical protein GCM10010503_66850 [Streptomyces lucensis JCM 4490]|uniref:Uncharacterized protein n=1 Tax=Streptomyces lucensis JCM 4490 TaxID=1306176 RepID=A0A918JGR7_9ACTN|nr:hypothetical protein [Streptomyces lucensis]GGW80000.1 hypothetical protein GCM10010503_66850 [Streptomyces lucensis JCM 4490]